MLEMEATRKSCFFWLVSCLLQFLWMLPRLQIWMPSSSRWLPFYEQQPVVVTSIHLPTPLVEFIVRKGSVAVLSVLNCTLKTGKSPGNCICTITGAYCKSPVVRAAEIAEGQLFPIAVLQIHL